MSFQSRFASVLSAFVVWALSVSDLHAEIRPVPEVQKALSLQGFEAGAADGLWGAKSVTALKGFQREHDLTPSGIITQETLRALFAAPGLSGNVSAPATGAAQAAALPASPTDTEPKPDLGSMPLNSTSPQKVSSGNHETNAERSGSSEGHGGYVVAAILFVVGVLALRGKKRTRRK
ncbi:peptidoglycan-binding domain-containing protein [Rhizobium sp. S152]|uniref:peptidoglycan-binding domain-containing protein n=1 Tax=Rhizobium sp. S152 TaxID=3055038 RepID=UPI0025A9E307|nr:peptidoglycan-binding domain-containing protein [Rhizobium sp. S152]MDM9627634.1 peptidoglycan-binding domain-containing protein [Rhizobium sp. S152]